MPILAEPSERPGCLPATKDDTFLPSISSQGSPDGYKNGSSESNNNSMNAALARTARESARDAAFKAHASAPGSESSTPFKLPSIDRSKSNSVTSLASDNKFGQRHSRGRSRDLRSKLCRSPSCPSEIGFWYDEAPGEEREHSPDTSRNSIDQTNKSVGRPYFTHREDSSNSSVKLPSIFQPRGSINSSFSVGTANSSAQTSRDTSPFSFKREATFLSINRNDHSPDHSNHPKLSPRIELNSRAETDHQRSGTQSSALLLPISNKDTKTSKGKRKRKKLNGMMATGDGHSEAEKLLREKLGAIERRECGEKTDLSDTAFINKVSDETTIANNDTSSYTSGRDGKSSASSNLASKPPMYQNSPARIKTEKAVAPVKA